LCTFSAQFTGGEWRYYTPFTTSPQENFFCLSREAVTLTLHLQPFCYRTSSHSQPSTMPKVRSTKLKTIDIIYNDTTYQVTIEHGADADEIITNIRKEIGPGTP
jgi:hypothetical protein